MPKVNHTILLWARETAAMSVEVAARKLQFKDTKTSTAEERLLAYENGAVSPSRTVLRKMSKIYRRPLLTFYLDKPPSIGDRGEDFRTLPDQFEAAENAYVDALIRDLKARQSLVRETLIDEDEEVSLDFVGKGSTEQSVESIAQMLRDILELDLREYRSKSQHGEAFKLLRSRAERAGVFVLLKGNLGSYHTDIGVTAFRGFALSDEIAPFIVINDRDAKSAWSFTLLHEMAHLVLGQTGVSGAYAEAKIEKFCNSVASEFLLPADEFAKFKLENLDFESVHEEISKYAFSIKVSSTHVAYRLYRRGDIKKDLWGDLRDYYRQQWEEQRKKSKLQNQEKDNGPSPYVLRRYKLGALVGLVQRLNYSGAISTTKAGMLLDIRPLKVHRLFEVNQAT